MKLDWKKTLLIGLGFFGVSVLWQLYDSFVPIFLQAGRPDFDSAVFGFGLDADTTGWIMGIDNLVAIIVLPLIGIWSDRIRTPIGRRYPFILTMAPLAALAFVLIPIAAGMITEQTSGNLSANINAFALFMTGAGLTLLTMAVLRTPVVSLMPDLTPSELRSKANGIINLMGGIGGVTAVIGLARLFDVGQILPFFAGSVILVVAMVVLFVLVKEPGFEDESTLEAHEKSDEEEALSGLKGIKDIPAENRKSLFLLMVAIFCWFVGYNGISTFFTSYAVDVLGLSEGKAPTTFAVAFLAFIAFAVPAGLIGESLGRRRTISIGLILFGVMLVIGYFMNSVTGIMIILGVGGAGWALVNINSLPMVVDTAVDDRTMGTFTGMYYFASQSASALAPGIVGTIIKLVGNDYRMIFLTGPVFFVLAIVAMRFVTRGESPAIAAKG